MAHFAKLGINGKVLQVLTLENKYLLNADNLEDETIGQQYLELHNNWPSQLWIQTSYNTYQNIHKLGGTPFRGNFAGIGYTWDEDNQVFWPPKPYPSWIKNYTNISWECPIGDAPQLTEEQISQSAPIDENTPPTYAWTYIWNEDNQTWDLTNTMA